MELHWGILDAKRTALLPKFSEWQKDGLYLAGGTALALYLGHRTSLDFDFYTRKKFNPLAQAEKLNIGAEKIRITTQMPGTLMAFVNGIQVSVFHYSYRLLKPLLTTRFLSLASIQDIAAMKLLAIAQRGKRRDFVDMYFLCQEFSLKEILRFSERKYPGFDPYSGLRGLLYFDEADHEPARVGIISKKPAAWDTVKRFFLKSAQGHLRTES